MSRNKEPISSIDHLTDLPLTTLSRMIRNNEITSTGLVEAYLDRIKTYDGQNGINAYITVAAELALRQADEADRLAKKGKFRGPLHGLPLAVKDNIETKGIRTTGGSRILSAWMPPDDAHVVRRLKRAGAIILGKTNMHEFALGVTNSNPHYGHARNPYDLSCIPGGSSGGSAAATAAALCAASLGTDTGGSVRIPASLCGVVGLKPTLGRVGRGGVIPLSFSRDCVGPITRTVSDAAVILEVIAGRDPIDPATRFQPILRDIDYPRGGLRGRRFALPKRFIEEMIQPDTKRVTDESIGRIRDMGGIVKEIDIRHIGLAHGADTNVVGPEAVYLTEAYLRKIDPRLTIGQYFDQMGEDVRRILSSHTGTPTSPPVPAHVYIKTLREDCDKMRAGFEEALSDVDALLLPTTPFPACRIGEDSVTVVGRSHGMLNAYIRNCVPVSVIGYPAISVPAGLQPGGAPHRSGNRRSSVRGGQTARPCLRIRGGDKSQKAAGPLVKAITHFIH